MSDEWRDAVAGMTEMDRTATDVDVRIAATGCGADYDD